MTGGHGHVIPRPDGAKARCGGPALCSVCAIELAQVQRERTAAGALLSLAAEFDRLAAETTAEVAAHEANNDDDVACMAYGARDAWQGAAARARTHARSVRSEGNEAAPVSREGQEPAADPEAPQRVALGMLVRAVWVAWAREQPDAKPSWLAGWAELDDGQREVDCRIGEAVAEAERERIALDLRARADDHDVMVPPDPVAGKRDHLLFSAGLRRAADLAEHGDQPMAAEPQP